MAKSTTIYKATVPVVPDIASITLTLSAEEAHALRTVLRHIGGSGTYTRRGLTEGISSVLEDAGVGYAEDVQGSLYFSTRPNIVTGREVIEKD